MMRKPLVPIASVLLLGTAIRADGAEPATKPARKKALNPTLVNLPVNTWVHLRTKRNPVGRSYSGVCYGAGTIFYFGGGHGSHPGNDVELYDVATNTWIQATEVESWKDIDTWAHVPDELKKATKRSIGGGSSSAVLSPKGRPLTLHTYQMHAYFPEKRAFYNQIAGGLWAFDPVKREWGRVNKRTFRRGDVHTQNLVYDPDLKTLFTPRHHQGRGEGVRRIMGLRRGPRCLVEGPDEGQSARGHSQLGPAGVRPDPQVLPVR